MTDPELPEALEFKELEHLFQRGDYRALRNRAANLRQRALEQEDTSSVEKIDLLLARLRPDPAGGLIYLLAFLMLVAIAWLTYSGAFG